MSRKTKSVSFSLDDPYELELYQYAMSHKGFSKYIKRLIDQAMNKGGNVQQKVVPIQQNARPIISASVNKEYLRQLI
jgi:hypothetical protein